VALVVLWTFGLMFLSGIPFGPVTATLTGLAVGIGVPYTIHIARRFEEDRSRYADISEAIRATMTNTGGALAGSALTTAAGFGILITSTLTPFRQLGQVVAYAILLSLAGAVLVLPSLLVLWERWHRRHGLEPSGRPTRALVGADGSGQDGLRHGQEQQPAHASSEDPSTVVGAPVHALASGGGPGRTPVHRGHPHGPTRSSTPTVAGRVAFSLLAVVVARRVIAALRRR
jgi:multidrug efflux pump subunit AcrB